jgi:hypothetical protein
MFRFSLSFFKTQNRFWRKRRTGWWKSNPHHSFEKLSKWRFQKINDRLARVWENVQTASRHYGTVLISASSWALLWFHRGSGSYPEQWKPFLIAITSECCQLVVVTAGACFAFASKRSTAHRITTDATKRWTANRI